MALNTLRPRQYGRNLPVDIFKCIFLNENVWISIKISLKFVPKGPINNILALVQIMAWRHPGYKPLSEAMMFNLPTHICVSRPHIMADQKLWDFENCSIWLKLPLQLVPKGPINNNLALVQIMLHRWPDASHYQNQWWLTLLMHIDHSASVNL